MPEAAESKILPTVRALDTLWTEVSAKPLWAPPNFRRYLALRWRNRLRLINPSRPKILAPAGKVNDCSQCTEICCIGKRATVLLRLRDIATLIDIGRTEIITQEKPTFSDLELKERPALKRHLETDAWKDFPVLRQNSFHACIALTKEGRCDLHPHWPLSCARFPYSLHADDVEVFYSRRCNSFWIRPEARGEAREMVTASVVGYNERIKDLVLLAYARDRLDSLGLTAHLVPG